MKLTPHEAAAQIITHYGVQHQLVKLCEECGELIQQACNCVDSGQPYSEDFVEELADVRVLTMQFETVMNTYWRREFENAVRFKLDRQLDRIATESEVHNDP
jgi:hypothetical protein